MIKQIAIAGTLALAAASVSVQAAPVAIKVTDFDIKDFNTATATTNFRAVEDFENVDVGVFADFTSTDVGKFSVFGNIDGEGSVCNAQTGGPCETLAINGTQLSGQGNILEDNGTVATTGGLRALSSNDTQGITWTIDFGGSMFDRIVFALRDAADQGGTTFTVRLGEDVLGTLSGEVNNNEKLVVIDLGKRVSEATVDLFNNQGDDGFTFDGGAALATPLPAAAWLFLSAIGGFGWMRKRRAQVAS